MYGVSQESAFREPRAACGAIVGCIHHFSPENPVHRRLHRDLGDENFAHLTTHPIIADDGSTNVTIMVAAAIVAIQGMKNTLEGLDREIDARGMGHTTASITVNRPKGQEMIYLARGFVFNGRSYFQGFGTDAKKFDACFRFLNLNDVYCVYSDTALGSFPLAKRRCFNLLTVD